MEQDGTVENADPALWDHLVQVLRLNEEERQALVVEQIKDLYDIFERWVCV
jgi:hypothetical protein